MNSDPNYYGQHDAGRLLKFITDFADREKKPVRLVSSAMNLDSFSLYTRAGFVPRMAYQDMYIPVPAEGLPCRAAGQYARETFDGGAFSPSSGSPGEGGGGGSASESSTP